MILWSLQSSALEDQLDKNPVYYVDWKHTPVNWRPAYEWMAQEMERLGLSLHGHAPVWAWHSCGQWHAPPTIGTALAQLTDYQLLNGMVIFELDVPDECCLLSRYSGFIQLIDEVVEHGELITPHVHRGMFCLPTALEGDDIQAALPCLRKEWVVDVRSVDLKPGKTDYSLDTPL